MPLHQHLSPARKALLRSLWNRWRHPRASLGPGTYVHRQAKIARGTVAGRNCAVLAEARVLKGNRLGDHTIVGRKSRVGRSTLGSRCTLEAEVELYNSTLADHVQLQRRSCVTDVNIGRYTYVGRNAYLNLATIGAFSSIGPAVLLGLGEHPIDFTSTSPAFYSTRRQCGETFAPADVFPERRPIIVGNDVWIGARAFIRDGVTIGDGAIVAAGAVVTRDVPPYAIVGGTPAKLIRLRFDESVIARLLAIAWWNWNDERLRAAQPLIGSKDIHAFLAWAESRPSAALPAFL